MRAAWLLGIAVVLSGCLSAGDPQDLDPSDRDAKEWETRSETRTEEFEASTGPLMRPGQEAASWDLELGARDVEVDFVLAWGLAANDFALRIEGAGGTQTQAADVRSTTIEGTLAEVSEGVVTFVVEAELAPLPDDLTLTVHITKEWMVPVEPTADQKDAGVGGAGEVREGEVRVRQDGASWVAEVDVTAEGPAPPVLRADVAAVNGRLEARSDGDRVVLTMTAWARGLSEDEARAKLAEIDVTAHVGEGEVHGSAEAPEWNDRGVHADLAVPRSTVVAGALASSNGPLRLAGLEVRDLEAATSNGPVQFDDVQASGLEAGTSNAPVKGTLTADGYLSLATSNGPVEVRMQPTGDLQFHVASSNAGVRLALVEGSDIGYRLGASTANGGISEDMDEAELHGEPTHGTLETRDFADRAIQVEGDVATANGNIHFTGA